MRLARLLERRVLLALVSGVLAVLAFPHADIGVLGFVLLVPLLAAVDGERPARAFALGMLMGVVYFAGSMTWIQYTLVRFGGMPLWLGVPVLLLLAVYLALYPALACMLLAHTREGRWPLPVRLAVLWTAMEGLRGVLLTGFPWNLLGHTMHRSLRVLQMADLGGVYLLSFYLALFNGLLYVGATHRERSGRLRALALAAALLAAGLAYGTLRLAEPLPEGSVRLALVQHNAAQEHKWDADWRREIVESLLRLSARVVGEQPDLLVWPEAALPFRFRHSPVYRKMVSDFVQMSGIPLLLGAPDKDPLKNQHYNSAFLLDATGEIQAHYHKMQLVPFGEYVPLEKILFFVNAMADLGGNWYPGTAYTTFELGEVRFSTFICYESVFGGLVRHFARRGAQFLVTITNDSWFGETAGTTQHLNFLPFRAVETRRPVAQAAQSGFTALYDQHGRLLARTGLSVEATLVGELRPARPGTWTPYMVLGDWVAYACWAGAVALGLEARRRRRPRAG
jgi:apolipoprotein N-acyltransferase